MMFTTQEGCHRTAWAKDDACSLAQMMRSEFQPRLSVSGPSAADHRYPESCRFFLAHFEKRASIGDLINAVHGSGGDLFLKVPARTSTRAETLCITSLRSLAYDVRVGTCRRRGREAPDTEFHLAGSSGPRRSRALFIIDSGGVHELASPSLEAPKTKGQGFYPRELQGMALTREGWA